MLGLADRTRTIDLFEAVMRGDMAAALGELRAQYDIGADPAVALSDLAEFTHFVTRVKVVPAVADDVSYAETERKRARAFAEKLSMRVLSRAWQMLLKGITEVEESGRPLAAAEMVLIRIAYAADLPTPDEVIRTLDGNGAAPAGRAPAVMAAARRAPAHRRYRVRSRCAAKRRAARRARRSQRRSRSAIPQQRRWRAAAPASSSTASRSLIALAAQEARPRRSRRRSSATCGWWAARMVGSPWRWSQAPPRPWSTISRASSHNGPGGAGWWWYPRKPRSRR